jgi:selenocysteine lyase/cysteine desulfurase
MKTIAASSLDTYFKRFRNKIVGIDEVIDTPYGIMPLVYTDWTASGRLYQPIEEKLINEFGAFVANTHTQTTYTGKLMTIAYEKARKIIKNHVHANDDDILIITGHGMTGAVNKLQRILGLKIPEKWQDAIHTDKSKRPVVFITHMEHHSNQTSWLETIAEVIIIPYSNEKDIDYEAFEKLLKTYKNRPLKIASVTACSNVTGLQPDYHRIASLIHQYQGYCFVDFACSAPYVDIDMHPDNLQYLDAIFFSPHKFLGGPGSSGVLIFNKKLYQNKIPDHPGGGTVLWTNPWGEHQYLKNPELREDGGTPGFMQTIKTALAIELKEEMGTSNILEREHQILEKLIPAMQQIDNLHLLAGNFTERLGVLSFTIDNLPYNLGVKLLNDKFGIQTRGGCSCAGTYGHILLGIDRKKSKKIVREIEQGDNRNKPGWIRLSIHPTTTNEEVAYIIKALKLLANHHLMWQDDYRFINGEYIHKNADDTQRIHQIVTSLFKL